jgi:hypothetical protein
MAKPGKQISAVIKTQKEEKVVIPTKKEAVQQILQHKQSIELSIEQKSLQNPILKVKYIGAQGNDTSDDGVALTRYQKLKQ